MDSDPSIEHEPHLRPESHKPDPSEGKADRVLGKESADRTRPLQSVHDEPAIFPGQDGKPIECDWTCSQCGYNLRGLTTGHRCPECGHIEVYYPPPGGAESYGDWFERQQATVTPRRSWTAVAIAAVAGGPFAIAGAFMNTTTVSWITLVVFAPVVEEVMKIAAASWLVEVRPYLLRDRAQILTIGVVSGLVFAAIENVLYILVYLPAPSTEILLWRLLGCTSLHVACTLVASLGLAKVWQRTVDELRPPKLSLGLPLLILAIVIHGGYNAAVSGLQWAGVLF